MHRAVGSLLAVALWALLDAPLAAAQSYHDNVVIILDASGSMSAPMSQARNGNRVKRMDAAKAALKEVLLQVPESTHVGLLVFSGRNVKDHWVYPLGPRNDEALLAAIDKPQPGGGTPLGKYIKIGADRLLQAREDQYGYGTYRLLLVTDGEAGDKQLVERYVPEVMARGITTDVIGVDMNQRHTLATKVHTYRSANDAASLTQAVADVFAELSQTDSDAAEIEAFDLLEAIPLEMGEAMIASLTKAPNNPIGTTSAAPAAATSSQTTSPSINRPDRSPRRDDASAPADTAEGGSTYLRFIVILAVVIMVSRVAFKRRKGRA